MLEAQASRNACLRRTHHKNQQTPATPREPLLITAYHAKYFAHELSRRFSSTDSERQTFHRKLHERYRQRDDTWCRYGRFARAIETLPESSPTPASAASEQRGAAHKATGVT